MEDLIANLGFLFLYYCYRNNSSLINILFQHVEKKVEMFTKSQEDNAALTLYRI